MRISHNLQYISGSFAVDFNSILQVSNENPCKLRFGTFFFLSSTFSSFCSDFQFFSPVWTRVSSSILNLFAKFCARGRGQEFEEKYLRVKVWTLEMRVFVMSVRLSFGCSSIRLFDVIANQLYMFVHTYLYKCICIWNSSKKGY